MKDVPFMRVITGALAAGAAVLALSAAAAGVVGSQGVTAQDATHIGAASAPVPADPGWA